MQGGSRWRSCTHVVGGIGRVLKPVVGAQAARVLRCKRARPKWGAGGSAAGFSGAARRHPFRIVGLVFLYSVIYHFSIPTLILDLENVKVDVGC